MRDAAFYFVVKTNNNFKVCPFGNMAREISDRFYCWYTHDERHLTSFEDVLYGNYGVLTFHHTDIKKLREQLRERNNGRKKIVLLFDKPEDKIYICPDIDNVDHLKRYEIEDVIPELKNLGVYW